MKKYYSFKKNEEFKYEFFSTPCPNHCITLFSDNSAFGSTDFTDQYYVLHSHGEFEDIELEYNIYERKEKATEVIGPLWLLTFGSMTYEILAFDSGLAMLIFFKNFKILRKE